METIRLKHKIIWALEYVKSNMDHIEEMFNDDQLIPSFETISTEEEVDEIIQAIKDSYISLPKTYIKFPKAKRYE